MGIPVQEVQDVPHSTPQSWAERQAQSADKWATARPQLIKELLEAEYTGSSSCDRCSYKTAVVRCRDCCSQMCATCDVLYHNSNLHNRDSMFEGYFHPLAPHMVVVEEEDTRGFRIKHGAHLLPVRMMQQCNCPPSAITRSPGKEVILIGINGRYQLFLPVQSCSNCSMSSTVGLRELLHAGYWPATTMYHTVYDANVLRSYRDIKQLAPGLSRQAFLGMLDERTKSFGRLKWGGRNQLGAGNTLGEEVEQTVKRAEQEERRLKDDMTTFSMDDNMLQQWVAEVQHMPDVSESEDQKKKIEGLYLSIKQRKHYLYRLQDSNKGRQRMRRKIREDTAAFSSAVEDMRAEGYEGLPTVEELLSKDHIAWPWETHGTRSDLMEKKKMFDQVMLVKRLHEEEKLLVKEMGRHLCSLNGLAQTIAGMLDNIQENENEEEDEDDEEDSSDGDL
ncbi:hypothetical protein ACEWY4_012534 [Coilia grayii]|uniref:CxC3 like cysteine cluster domain-containing protein n=1 Tax=Coilia grayii TaxID=363190 RepID=A0ABD1K0T3_9TELE